MSEMEDHYFTELYESMRLHFQVIICVIEVQ